MLEQFLINGFITGLIYALLALGFSLVYNTTKIFHIAYAVLYMASGYFYYSFFNLLNINIFASITLALLCVILLSVLMEILVYKPLRKRKASLQILLVSSLGIMIIGINLMAMIYGNETKIISNSIAKSITLGKVIITYPQLYQLIFSASAIILFFVFLKSTRVGLTLRALKDDELLASVFGLNINVTRIKVFALSGFFVALAGILMANDIGFDPYVGLPMLLNAVVALIIGGIGRYSASLLGGLILGLLQALVIWKFSTNWQEAVSFVVLILFLLFKPQGILGEKTRKV